MSGKCNRCGRLGAWMGLCPDCRRVDAEEKRNRILENQALQEQKAREEQTRLERMRDEQERKYREEQSRRERERDEQERKFREEQLRQEREDRQRQLEAENRIQEERLQIERERMEAEQQRYEEEKREREWKEQQERLERERQEQERAWADRCESLDNLSDEEMKDYFENSANSDEREYLKQRYRKSVSSQEYLALIKDENKYVMKKRIQNYISSHSDKESVDCLLNIDSDWYADFVEKDFLNDFIVKKEPLLEEFFKGEWLKNNVNEIKDFGDVAIKSCKLLKDKYDEADGPRFRQIILRIIVGYLRFLEMSSVEKQIFFREFIENQMKGVEYNPDGYETENGILYSLIEPLYVNSLEPAEQEEYLKKMKKAEEEYRAKQEEKRIAEERRKAAEELRRQKIAEREKVCDDIQREYDEKWQENEKVVEECNKAGAARLKITKKIEGLNWIVKKHQSQIIWSILIFGCYSLVLTKNFAFTLITPAVLFFISITMFVKQHKVIGVLSVLSILSFLLTTKLLGDENPELMAWVAGLFIVNSPLIALGIYAVKKIIDVKRLNAQIQKKAVEHDEKLEKQNTLAEKNAKLIKEIEAKQKKIDKIQREIESIKVTEESEFEPEIEELMKMN